MIETDVLILGAGLAGLSAAYHLGRLSRLSSLILEKNGRPGGTAASIVDQGFTFDWTGHLLHLHDPYGKKLIAGLLRGNLEVRRRNSWIYSHQTLTRYPFQANTYGLPDKVVDECLLGFLKNVHRPPPEAAKSAPSFKDWALDCFGEGICEHFLFPYNEKLWQRPLSQLTTEWQGRFVPRPEPSAVLYGAMMDQKTAFGYNASFYYPKRGGIQSLADALAKKLKPGQVRLRCPALKIDLSTRTAEAAGTGRIRFKKLVNTMPLVDFLPLCQDLPARVWRAAEKLSYNSVYCLNLGVPGKIMPGKHWIYFPEKKFPFYRVGFYHAFSPSNAPPGRSALYVEFSRRNGDKISLDEMEAAALKALRSCGVLPGKDKPLVKRWLKIPCAYVVYDFKRPAALRVIFDYLKSLGVFSIGRYGAWKYSFMEEAILDGKACAEALSREHRHV